MTAPIVRARGGLSGGGIHIAAELADPGLAVAFGEAREDAQNFRVPLTAERGVGEAEARFIECGIGCLDSR